MADDPRLPNAGYNPPLASGLARSQDAADPNVYPDPMPARPTNIPPERPATPLAHLDTAYLNNAQKALRSNIPSDPTFMAHVGAILRAIIAFDLQHPDRIAADKAAAEAHSDAVRQHAIAQAPEEKRDEVAAEHDRKAALAELDAKQEADRKEFARIQQEQRQAVLIDAQPEPVQ